MNESDKKDMEECKKYFGKHWGHHHGHRGGGGGVVYCLGFIGALVFFIGHATTFWAGVLGFFQALVWPAFLVYEALKVLIK
jgi:hypothetical protein